MSTIKYSIQKYVSNFQFFSSFGDSISIMLGFVKKLFDYNQKELSRIGKIVEHINELEDDARKLKDKDFSVETKKLKESVQSGDKTLDDVLPWAYAMVREVSRRIF